MDGLNTTLEVNSSTLRVVLVYVGHRILRCGQYIYDRFSESYATYFVKLVHDVSCVCGTGQFLFKPFVNDPLYFEEDGIHTKSICHKANRHEIEEVYRCFFPHRNKISGRLIISKKTTENITSNPKER